MTRERCAHMIEREWKGHRAVLSRRRCRNPVGYGSLYCHVHRPRKADQ